MDTSETYIKMCDCPEIQEYHVKLPKLITNGLGSNCQYYGYTNKHVWLPRQDQIQEMLNYGIGALVNDFEEFCVCKLNMLECPDDFPKTMEQLWLVFYMWEKHSKTWDGKKWVKK